VLVTGGDGFIGSHLVEALVGGGARVSVLVRAASGTAGTDRPFKRIRHGPAEFEEVLFGDVASSDVPERIERLNPDYVFHLAASAWVNHSFSCPDEVFRTNATGTLRVLEGARRATSLKRLVVTSSSEVYGSRQSERIDEHHPLMPTSPYGASKVAADRLAWAWHVTWGIPLAILRPFNTYGPRHTYDVIPKFIRRALRGEPLTIYGSGLQERDFSYVSDTVRGFLMAGLAGNAEGEVFNLGSGSAWNILELAKHIISLSKSASEIAFVEKRAAEVDSLICDGGKALSQLGYRTKVSMEEGLARNIEWEREYALSGMAR